MGVGTDKGEIQGPFCHRQCHLRLLQVVQGGDKIGMRLSDWGHCYKNGPGVAGQRPQKTKGLSGSGASGQPFLRRDGEVGGCPAEAVTVGPARPKEEKEEEEAGEGCPVGRTGALPAPGTCMPLASLPLLSGVGSRALPRAAGPTEPVLAPACLMARKGTRHQVRFVRLVERV